MPNFTQMHVIPIISEITTDQESVNELKIKKVITCKIYAIDDTGKIWIGHNFCDDPEVETEINFHPALLDFHK